MKIIVLLRIIPRKDKETHTVVFRINNEIILQLLESHL